MNYQFTIVMTVYERVDLLLRAFYSVLTQDEQAWELIIVADGPHPDAEEMIYDFIRCRPKYQDKISYMTVTRVPDSWSNGARRQGLLRAHGDFTCFVDHDYLLSAAYLKTHRTNLERTTVPALSVVGVEYWRTRPWEPQMKDYWGAVPLRVRQPAQWGVGDLDLACVAFPTKSAIRLGLFAGSTAMNYTAGVEGFLACCKELRVVYDLTPAAAHF